MRKMLRIISVSKRKLAMLASTILLLSLASAYDYSLTLYLRENDWPAWSEFMDRSWFEGEAWGFGDLPVFFYILVLCAWISSFLPLSTRSLKQWRLCLSYIVIHCLLTAVVIHLLKGIMARPRPGEVFGGVIGFRPWFDLQSPQLHGWGKGSFPSGHTANVASLISLTYVLGFWLDRQSLWVSLTRVLIVCLIVSMGLSRVMHGAHWFTDTIAAAAITWWLADAVFHRLLCVPKQKIQSDVSRPRLWEFRLLVMLLPACLNLAMALFALRLLAHSLYVCGTLYLISALGVAYVLFRTIGFWQESLFPSNQESLVPPLDSDSLAGPLLSTVACQDSTPYQ